MVCVKYSLTFSGFGSFEAEAARAWLRDVGTGSELVAWKYAIRGLPVLRSWDWDAGSHGECALLFLVSYDTRLLSGRYGILLPPAMVERPSVEGLAYGLRSLVLNGTRLLFGPTSYLYGVAMHGKLPDLPASISVMACLRKLSSRCPQPSAASLFPKP